MQISKLSFHKIRLNIILVLIFTFGFTLQFLKASDRTTWFRDARFGMFIHWGPYSLKGFEASWPLFQRLIPMKDYEALAERFNPEKFNAEKIVKLAQDAGMKYLIITSKHHDGFAMFDTEYSDYSIMNAPYRNDIVKQIVDACHKAEMRVGFYFSLCDWYHPDYRDRTKPFPEGCKPEEAPEDTWLNYLTFMTGQITELCTNYGKIDVIWFDGGWERTAEQWQSQELDRMIRSLQPGVLINNRHLLEEEADFGTPEQFVPTGRQTKLWESCMTINNTWAYNPTDHNYKSTKELVQNLARTAAGGGNFLLNIGPMPTGEVQPEFTERLEGIGEWMKVNGESIYGTHPGPSRLFRQGMSTLKNNRLFVHVLEGPDGDIVLKGIKNKINSVSSLRTGEPVDFCQNGLNTILRVPYRALDPFDTVIEISFEGDSLEYDGAVYPDDTGMLIFPAYKAEIVAPDISYTLKHELTSYSYYEDALKGWTMKNERVLWEYVIPKEGEYEVILNYQGQPKAIGLIVQKHAIPITEREYKNNQRFTDVSIGKIHLKAFRSEMIIRVFGTNEDSEFKLRQVTLKHVQ